MSLKFLRFPSPLLVYALNYIIGAHPSEISGYAPDRNRLETGGWRVVYSISTEAQIPSYYLNLESRVVRGGDNFEV